MIQPTIGRIVYFHPPFVADSGENEVTHAAIVTQVHSDTHVNLAVFDSEGMPYIATAAFLFQGEGVRPTGPYAEWMPFQLAQAAAAAGK